MNPTSTRRIVAAGTIGNLLEWYDFAIYGYFAATIGRVFFPAESSVAQVLRGFGIFALGYLMRPLGGMVVGHIGDRYGRRAALTFSISAMAVPTFLVGLLPGYETLGMAAPILLTLLRMIQGLSVGGEATTSMVLPGRAGTARPARPGRQLLLAGRHRRLPAGLGDRRDLRRPPAGRCAGDLGLARSVPARARPRRRRLVDPQGHRRRDAGAIAPGLAAGRDGAPSRPGRGARRRHHDLQRGRLLPDVPLRRDLAADGRRHRTGPRPRDQHGEHVLPAAGDAPVRLAVRSRRPPRSCSRR